MIFVDVAGSIIYVVINNLLKHKYFLF